MFERQYLFQTRVHPGVKSKFTIHDLLKLLRHTDRIVVLILADLAAVQKVLHLLPRITPKLLPELLKPLQQIVSWLRIQFFVQRIHYSIPSCFLFAVSACLSVPGERLSPAW